MANEDRFSFPGFTTTNQPDTETYLVEVGRIEDGGTTFVLRFIRRTELPDYVPFILANVMDASGEKRIWEIKQERFQGKALLAPTKRGLVIVLVGPGRDGEVERIIPFSQFASGKPIGLRGVIEMKREAASFLELGCRLTRREEQSVKDRQEARLAQEAAQVAAEREARAARRREHLQMLLNRTEIVGYTADGQPRRGIPVVGNDEWASLPHGFSAILVDSIDEDGTCGNLIEAFRVKKPEGGGNPRKEYRVPVTAKKPTVTVIEAAALRPTKSVWVRMLDDETGEEDEFEVLVFPSNEAIKKAHEGGLNGSTLAAVDGAVSSKGKIEVFALREQIETVGHFAPVV